MYHFSSTLHSSSMFHDSFITLCWLSEWIESYCSSKSDVVAEIFMLQLHKNMLDIMTEDGGIKKTTNSLENVCFDRLSHISLIARIRCRATVSCMCMFKWSRDKTSSGLGSVQEIRWDTLRGIQRLKSMREIREGTRAGQMECLYLSSVPQRNDWWYPPQVKS